MPSRELLAVLLVCSVVPAVVLVAGSIGFERTLRFSLGALVTWIAVAAPVVFINSWVIGAGLSEVSVSDQTIAGYFSAASVLPFVIFIARYFRDRHRAMPPILMWIAFVVLVAASSLLSPLSVVERNQRLLGLFNCLGLAMASLLARPRDRIIAVGVLAGTLAAHSVVGIAQFVGQFGGFDVNETIYRVAGIFGWSNTLGYLLAVVLPLVLCAAAGSTGRLRWLCVVASALAALALLLTFSRAALVAVFGAVVAMGFVRAWSHGLESRYAMTGLAVVAVAVMSAAVLNADFTSRFVYGDSANDLPTLNGRTRVWDLLLGEEPTLFGHGLWASRELLDRLDVPGRAPHNLYIESWYDFGVVGVAVLLAFHVVLLRQLARLSHRRGLDGLLATGGFGGVVASLLLGLSGSEFFHFSVGYYFFLIAFLPLGALLDEQKGTAKESWADARRG